MVEFYQKIGGKSGKISGDFLENSGESLETSGEIGDICMIFSNPGELNHTSMAWFSWEHPHRKPCFFSRMMGFSCTCVKQSID